MLTREKRFYKNLVGLSLPLILQNTVNFLITLTDNLMVGSLGDSETSAAYAAMMINTVFVMLISGIESGILVGAVQHRGSEKAEEADAVSLIGGSAILILGALAAAAAAILPSALVSPFLRGAEGELAARYLRTLSPSFIPSALSGALGAYAKSIEKPSLCLVSSAASLATNASLDYILIFGRLGFSRMGVLGSAVAFSLAKTAEALCLALLIILARRRQGKPLVKISSARGFCRRRELAEFFRYTSPLIFAQTVWIINTLFSSFIIGKLNTGAHFAGFAVASTLGAVTYIIPNALSIALGIEVSLAVGSDKQERLREYTYTAQLIFIVLGLVTAGALQAIKYPMVSLYGISDEARGVAVSLINVLSVTSVGTAYSNALLSGIVKSGGDVSFILKNDSFFIFLVLIPLTLAAFRLDAPLWVVFLCLKSDHILKCIPAAIRINGFRWIKNLAKD